MPQAHDDALFEEAHVMMLVEHVLDGARRRLAILSCEALVSSAAEILVNPNTPLAVVCDSAGVAVGVVSRTDVVKALAVAGPDACSMSADAVMSRQLVSCHPLQPLHEVWDLLKAQSLRCAPVLDDEGRPQGILHARDLATALLEEVESEELLLRDYILGVGYQ